MTNLRFVVLEYLNDGWQQDSQTGVYADALTRLHQLRKLYPGRSVLIRDRGLIVALAA